VGTVPTGPVRAAAVTTPSGYSLLTGSSQLLGYGGGLDSYGLSLGVNAPVGLASTSDGKGSWAVDAAGDVAALGDAAALGSMSGHRLYRPVVGMAADPAGTGYWLVASDGGVFSFGAARFHGSTGAIRLNKPVVGMAATPDGGGYWLVASDGGVFSFGDARFHGSTGAIRLNKPVVGMAATPDGGGYWLVASDGGVFSFGDARFYGSTGNLHLVAPVVGMAAAPDGAGYWMVAADGGIFNFGSARFLGSGSGSGQTVVGMDVTRGGTGGPYMNPMRGVSGLVAMRIDEGVDYGGSGPVYAIGDGVVVSTLNAGWPGGAFICYELTDGPAKGLYVYVAENLRPTVTIGQHVTAQTVVGQLIDGYPYMETGWADPPGWGDTLASAAGQWNATMDSQDIPSVYGTNFSDLLVHLGAPAGIAFHAAQGTLSPGFPTW
jgi:hypothetical protein